MDVLSDVLRTIRLEGALFLNGDMYAPWCFKVPRGADIAQVLRPGAQRLAICHLVLQGECWAQVEGEAPLRAHAGDVIAAPHGDSHVLGSGLQHAAVDMSHVVSPRAPELARVRYGGQGDRTLLVCSWFAYEGDAPNPVMANIPRLFTTPLRSRPAGPWIEQSVNFVLGDAASHAPGSEMVAAKVAEVLFTEVLRGYIESMPANNPGWLAGLRDPHVSRCLALMHAEPARNWTVDALAQEIHVSRSVLAEPLHRTGGRAAHALPGALAHGPGRRHAAQGPGQPGAHRRRRGLRIGSRFQSRVQARVRRVARGLAAQRRLARRRCGGQSAGMRSFCPG